ncbi:MAG: MFS transporter [Acidobacteria bacterium]|nr:MFS transporter [Acidobacteriota bacterium]
MPTSTQFGSDSPLRGSPARWIILALLGAISATSYIERVCISVMSPLIMHDLKLDQPRMGQVFSAFLLGYSLFQYSSGSLADRLGSRRVLAWAMLSWGVLTIFTAAIEVPFIVASVGSFAALLAVRFLFGITEAPTYPASSRVVSSWFERTEQARAWSVACIGMGLGSAIAPPLVARLMLAWGWKQALLMLSAPAFLLAAIWGWKGGDKPGWTSPKVSAPSRISEPSVLRNLNAWILTGSYFLNNYVSYVFVFWFFPYLVQVRKFDILESSWLATAPWILTIVLSPMGGVASDWSIRRFGDTRGRRVVPIVGMVIAAILLYLGAEEKNAYLAVFELTLCEGMVLFVDPVYWATAMKIAPESAGRSGGMMNMGGNFGGFVSASLTPLVASQIGWIGSLRFTAAMTVVAALLWIAIKTRSETTPDASILVGECP